MAELSPAAWAVAAAASVARDHGRSPIAAVLRAAAEWVIPDNSDGNDCCIDTCEAIHADVLAIATELEDHQ